MLNKKIMNVHQHDKFNGKLPTKSLTNDTTLIETYEALSQKSESSFAILSFFQEEFEATHYDSETDRFVIDHNDAFTSQVLTYLNSDSHTIQEKLYLASVMQMQQSGLNFDIDAVLSGIDNEITKTLVKDIYRDKSVVFLANESVDDSNVIVGSSEADDIKVSGNSKTIMGEGDDILQSGSGHNSFYFRRGDGSDVIQDSGGFDALVVSINNIHFKHHDREVA